ncbi:hypothetical protein KQI63_13535 [bacterium]|nr:hypothetical protein [bacterium]
MKAHYRKTAKQLASALQVVDEIATSRDLAHLHRFVVDLKTSLPERLAYENSQLLLDGLRVTQTDAIPSYLDKLRTRLSDLRDGYLNLSK